MKPARNERVKFTQEVDTILSFLRLFFAVKREIKFFSAFLISQDYVKFCFMLITVNLSVRSFFVVNVERYAVKKFLLLSARSFG